MPLIEALVEEAEGDGMSVLRTYWYDGAYEQIPNVQQRAVGRATRVKLRLGTMTHGRQKGVDRLMQRDILALASNKAVTDLIALTGDQDMEEELDVAGQHGLLIHLWGIADQEQQDSISGRLLRIVDDWKVLPAHWALTFVPDLDQPGAEAEAQVPLTSDRDLDEFRSNLLGFDAAARASLSGTDAWSAEQLHAVGHAAYDTLKEQYGETWSEVQLEIKDSRWARSNGELVRSIPARYDTELMDTAEAIVGQRLVTPTDRTHVRDGFWSRLDENT